MRITWLIMDQGAGEAEVASADDAASKLRAVVHELHVDNPHLMTIRKLVQVMRMQMVTDGAAAVARGEDWEITQGGITVKLSPSQR